MAPPRRRQRQRKVTEPKLTDEQLDAAVDELVVDFPHVQRRTVDPEIPGQTYAVMSYVLLDKPTDQGLYGFMKVRGSYATEEAANERAEKLLRSVDSAHKYQICLVGNWAPLAVSEKFMQDVNEIDLDGVYDAAEKDAEKKRKQDIHQLKERAEKLQKEVNDPHSESNEGLDDPDNIKYFIKLMLKKRSQVTYINDCKKRIQDTNKILKRTLAEISEASERHPEFVDEWENVYRKELLKIGTEEIPENPTDAETESAARGIEDIEDLTDSNITSADAIVYHGKDLSDKGKSPMLSQ